MGMVYLASRRGGTHAASCCLYKLLSPIMEILRSHHELDQNLLL